MVNAPSASTAEHPRHLGSAFYPNPLTEITSGKDFRQFEKFVAWSPDQGSFIIAITGLC
jgi:hypothetical protein